MSDSDDSRDFSAMLGLDGMMNRRIAVALVDLSGTIHIEDTAIKGAIEALQRLTASGVKVRYVTNTTKEPIRLLHERLTRLGFAIKMADIFTSLSAARRLVEKKRLRPLLLLEESAKEDFDGLQTEDPNAVVVGLAPSCFDYQNMNNAFRLLLDGASLVAIHMARYYQQTAGLSLGPGAFVTALEYASGVTAEVVGKPQKSFFLQAIDGLYGDPSQIVMIGDDARDDIGGAVSAGMLGVLVKTGKYRAGDEVKFTPAPSAVCDDISAAVDWVLL